MKRAMIAGFSLAIACSIGAAGMAQSARRGPASPKKVVLICPVTGDKIASAKAAAGHSVFKGRTYYFCCPACKPRFDKSPAKFVKNAAHGKFEKM